MDIQPIIDGLQVSGIGMGMTSVVLVILAVSVRVVSWADAALRRREAQSEADELQQSNASVVPETTPKADVPDPRARAAAIAVALALAQQSQEHGDLVSQTQTPASTSAVHDAWLNEGRARQRARRRVAGSARDRR